MVDPFASEIQWSSDKFSLQKVVELFHLPQVVRINHLSSSSDKLKVLHDDDLLVVHSLRNMKIVRATDALKNEYHVPLDSAAKVEVIWKRYKAFYDNCEQLYEDHPTHLLVEKDDEKLGITKGDVLKLEQKVSSQEKDYLQCSLRGVPGGMISIPYDYNKWVFRTLGDFTERFVPMDEAVSKCKLPISVKFIDNKLKMKKVDGSSRYPMGLYNIDGYVTLHEVFDHSDVVVLRVIPEESVNPLAISLECRELEVKVPTAATRTSSRYDEFCSKVMQQANPGIARRLGVEHNHWIVFQDDDGPASPTSKQVLEQRTSRSVTNVSISQSDDLSLGKDSSSNLQDIQMPNGVEEHPPQSTESTEITASAIRRPSHTFPRVLKPFQLIHPDESTEKLYEPILIGKINQTNPEEERVPEKHSRTLDKRSLYVSMKSNVITEKMIEEWRREMAASSSQQRGDDYMELIVDQMKDSYLTPMTEQSHVPKGRRIMSKESLMNRPRLPPPRETQSSPPPPELMPRENIYQELPSFKVKKEGKSALPQDEGERNSYQLGHKHVKEWSENDVSAFLTRIGLGKYVKLFKEKKVNGKVLMTLNESTLVKHFKMTDKSHVQKLLKYKEEILKHDRFTVENEYETH